MVRLMPLAPSGAAPGLATHGAPRPGDGWFASGPAAPLSHAIRLLRAGPTGTFGSESTPGAALLAAMVCALAGLFGLCRLQGRQRGGAQRVDRQRRRPAGAVQSHWLWMSAVDLPLRQPWPQTRRQRSCSSHPDSLPRALGLSEEFLPSTGSRSKCSWPATPSPSGSGKTARLKLVGGAKALDVLLAGLAGETRHGGRDAGAAALQPVATA